MYRLTFLVLLGGLAAAPVLADPGYYRVTGVAADDTLNVRVTPDGDSADIGDLPHDAEGIEVIATNADGKWGQIVWQEGNGWIAMRFLAAQDMPRVGDSALPAGLLCSGTEPFWSLRLASGGAVYSDPDGTMLSMELRDARPAEGRPAFPLAMRFAAEGGSALSIVAPQICSDGMSDRSYGYALTQLVRTDTEERFLEGCCWLPLEIGAH